MPSVVENIYSELEDSWVEEFISLIQVEVRAYKALLNKLEVQRYAIIDRDLLHITELNEDTEACITDAKDASAKRYDKIKQVSEKIRPSKELNSIEQVIPICKRQYADRLLELRQNLIDTLKKIKNTNQINHYLLEKSLEFVTRNLELIYREAGRSDKYGQNGKMNQQKDVSTISHIA
ncbi:MAG TPA: flagellar protein FlgN [bacterium]|nr:flagellar protein FlgN [bacterium]HPN43216.1 flagellar protein FlgN [bacterium]